MFKGHYDDDTGAEAALRVWDIEDALQWVVNDELPKIRDETGGRSVGGFIHPMWSQGAFCSRIDNWNKPPGYPAALGDPDPDALVIAAAVRNLDVSRLVLRDTLITYDLPGEYDSALLLERARAGVRDSIIVHAAMKKRPPLDETVHLEKVVNDYGRVPIFRVEAGREVHTRAYQGGAYPSGAYCKLRETPSPAARALLRAEYAVWWLGSQHVARQLQASGMLGRISLRTPRAPQYPWVPGEAHSPQVRASSRGSIDMGGRVMDLSQRRPTARRMPGRRPSEVRRIPVEQYTLGGAVQKGA